jgi:hypothetical protein
MKDRKEGGMKEERNKDNAMRSGSEGQWYEKGGLVSC